MHFGMQDGPSAGLKANNRNSRLHFAHTKGTWTMAATEAKPKAAKKAETFRDSLRRIGACEEARDWAGDRTARQVWADCERPDWMLWLLGKVDDSGAGSPTRRKYVAIACECARLTLDIFEEQFPDDKRPRNAIELCERYAAGEDIFFEDIRNASYAAWNASAAAWNASYAALSASAAAWNASGAALSASDAAVSASDAALSASAAALSASGAALRAILLKACDIIRKHFPKCPKV